MFKNSKAWEQVEVEYEKFQKDPSAGKLVAPFSGASQSWASHCVPQTINLRVLTHPRHEPVGASCAAGTRKTVCR